MSEKKRVFKCKNCEAIVNDSDKHCPECGKEFISDAPKLTIGMKTVPQFLSALKPHIETALFQKDKDKERHKAAMSAIDQLFKELKKAAK